MSGAPPSHLSQVSWINLLSLSNAISKISTPPQLRINLMPPRFHTDPATRSTLIHYRTYLLDYWSIETSGYGKGRGQFTLEDEVVHNLLLILIIGTWRKRRRVPSTWCLTIFLASIIDICTIPMWSLPTCLINWLTLLKLAFALFPLHLFCCAYNGFWLFPND